MRDITSPDGKDNASSMAKPGEGMTVSEALEKDVRKKKKITNDNVEISNFEQYISFLIYSIDIKIGSFNLFI